MEQSSLPIIDLAALKGVPDLLLRLVRAKKDLYVITNDASKSPERMAQSFSHAIEG